jgi:hypothetical protein
MSGLLLGLILLAPCIIALLYIWSRDRHVYKELDVMLSNLPPDLESEFRKVLDMK